MADYWHFPILTVLTNMLTRSRLEWKIIYYNESVQQDLVNLPAGIQARHIHQTDRMLMHDPNTYLLCAVSVPAKHINVVYIETIVA